MMRTPSRRVRITVGLRAGDAETGAGAAAPEAWWAASADALLRGIAELGACGGTGPLHATRDTAHFTAEVPVGVVSEAVRLCMSWIGRSPQRTAELTGPHGDMLPLDGRPGPGEQDRIATWLAASTARGD
ncbi:hypothetical protein AB0910_12945 [Streptomyces sp. NPDC047002]|uniref:hypothetical protein n=1 Tax=Streptomyces sp. NPDC047002 TaxID=3155475 RepID=UPI003453A14A